MIFLQNEGQSYYQFNCRMVHPRTRACHHKKILERSDLFCLHFIHGSHRALHRRQDLFFPNWKPSNNPCLLFRSRQRIFIFTLQNILFWIRESKKYYIWIRYNFYSRSRPPELSMCIRCLWHIFRKKEMIFKSHLISMTLYAILACLVLALIRRDEIKSQIKYGVSLFLIMVFGSLVFGWFMSLFIWQLLISSFFLHFFESQNWYVIILPNLMNLQSYEAIVMNNPGNVDYSRVKLAVDARRKGCSCGISPQILYNEADAVRSARL